MSACGARGRLPTPTVRPCGGCNRRGCLLVADSGNASVMAWKGGGQSACWRPPAPALLCCGGGTRRRVPVGVDQRLCHGAGVGRERTRRSCASRTTKKIFAPAREGRYRAPVGGRLNQLYGAGVRARRVVLPCVGHMSQDVLLRWKGAPPGAHRGHLALRAWPVEVRPRHGPVVRGHHDHHGHDGCGEPSGCSGPWV